MKKFYIEVPGTNYPRQIVEADYVYPNSTGCYIFYIKNEEGPNTEVGFYPIDRTIIYKIEDV